MPPQVYASSARGRRQPRRGDRRGGRPGDAHALNWRMAQGAVIGLFTLRYGRRISRVPPQRRPGRAEAAARGLAAPRGGASCPCRCSHGRPSAISCTPPCRRLQGALRQDCNAPGHSHPRLVPLMSSHNAVRNDAARRAASSAPTSVRPEARSKVTRYSGNASDACSVSSSVTPTRKSISKSKPAIGLGLA